MQLAFERWPLRSPSEPSQISHTKMVLLHGLGGTGRLWRPVAAGLEDSFEILALDQRGHGKSRNPTQKSFTPLDFGNDAIETMEAQNFHPAILIGHSMGVRSACAIAHLKPDWVTALILIDLGFSGPPGGGLGEPLAKFIEHLPNQFPSRSEAKTYLYQHSPDPAIAQYLLAVSESKSDGRIEFPFDHHALIETIHASKLTSTASWMEGIAKRGTPALILRGAESLVWSKQDFEESRRRFAAHANLKWVEVAGAGHALPFEKRKEFLEVVRNFVQNLHQN